MHWLNYDIIIPEKIPALGPKNGGRLFDLRSKDHWFKTDTTGTAFMSLGNTHYPLARMLLTGRQEIVPTYDWNILLTGTVKQQHKQISQKSGYVFFHPNRTFFCAHLNHLFERLQVSTNSMICNHEEIYYIIRDSDHSKKQYYFFCHALFQAFLLKFLEGPMYWIPICIFINLLTALKV